MIRRIRLPVVPLVLGLVLALALAIALILATAHPSAADRDASVTIGASMKYDLAYSLYALADADIGGIRYRAAYPDLWPRFRSALSPASLGALDSLRALRARGVLYGAGIASLLERSGERDLPALIDALRDEPPAVAAEVRSWGEADEALYRSIAPGVISILGDLDRGGFEEYWRSEIEPVLRRKADSLGRSGIASLDLSESVARYSGKPARPIRVRLYPVFFMFGQGQQILSRGEPEGASELVYLGSAEWSDEDFKLQLIHETMHHQILDWNDPAAKRAAAELGKDPYFAQVFERQKTVSGYGTIEGFVEENVTEAVQMLIAEDLGIEADPVAYLRVHDGGSHVLSQALLRLVAAKSFAPKPGRGLASFVLEEAGNGDLGPGAIERLSSAFLRRDSVSSGSAAP